MLNTSSRWAFNFSYFQANSYGTQSLEGFEGCRDVVNVITKNFLCSCRSITTYFRFLIRYLMQILSINKI